MNGTSKDKPIKWLYFFWQAANGHHPLLRGQGGVQQRDRRGKWTRKRAQ